MKRIIPMLRWWPHVTYQSTRSDLIAGLTGAILVLPQGVAFATIAGMPPEYGLYAAMVPAIIAALLGSSWHLVSGPTTAASIVMFSALSTHAEPGSVNYIQLAITLTFMVGLIQLLMGLARFGALINFISNSVIIGFTAGAAILIVTKQAKYFFGLEIPSESHFYEIIYYVFTHTAQIHPVASLVSITTLLTGIFVRKFWVKIPYLMAALLIGSLVGFLLNLIFQESTTGIHMIGALPKTLPPLSTPSLSFTVIKELAPAALAMTLFALMEAVSIARSISLRSGQPIEANQEFIGQGLSNIVGSFFSAYVATGSFNRSGVNYDAGAKTPLAAVFAGVLLILILPVVAPLTAYLPTAVIAGLLFLVAWRLIDFARIKKIIRASNSETLIMTVTFLGTLFLELEFAILLGVTLSLMIYLKRTSKPNILTRVPDPSLPKRKFTTSTKLPECPQLKMIRIDGSLYFGAFFYVQEILRRLREHYPQQKHLLLLSQGINHIDVSGAELLVDEVNLRRLLGGEVYFYKLKDSARGVLKKGGYIDLLNSNHIYTSKGVAIASIFENLDKDICKTCDKRIFTECASIPKIENESCA